jgi:membrane protein implicated in regulation of membrane protease activity
MKKIPKKYAPIVAGLLMSSMMGFIMSGIVTAINIGVPSNFIALWMGAFIKVVPIAFFAVIIVRPIVERFIKKYTE